MPVFSRFRAIPLRSRAIPAISARFHLDQAGTTMNATNATRGAIMNAQVVRGTVKFFLALRGYGFAVPEGAEPGARDVYLHWSQIVDQDQPGRKTLAPGQVIQFQIVRGKNGRLAAINIQSADIAG